MLETCCQTCIHINCTGGCILGQSVWYIVLVGCVTDVYCWIRTDPLLTVQRGVLRGSPTCLEHVGACALPVMRKQHVACSTNSNATVLQTHWTYYCPMLD